MPLENNPMAEFFEKIGQRVIRSESSWWYEVQTGVLLSFPYYKLIDPSQDEINELIGKYKLRAIRYPTPIDAYGFFSTLELNTNPKFDLKCLEREARRQTRRGLEACKFQQIDFDFLFKHGIVLNKETAKRQGRGIMYTDNEYWKKYCMAGKMTSGVTAWGVMVDGKLGTYLVSVEYNGWWNWLLTHSSTAFLKQRTSNVLFYEGPRSYFEKNPENNICYGLGSLEGVHGLDRFKVNMGVDVKYIKQRLVFSKRLRSVFALAQEPCLKALNKIFPKNYTVRKASSMIRLYRQQVFGVPEDN